MKRPLLSSRGLIAGSLLLVVATNACGAWFEKAPEVVVEIIKVPDPCPDTRDRWSPSEFAALAKP